MGDSGAHPITAPERVETTGRRAEAMRLRIGGFTFDQIGTHLGITRQAAHQLVTGALKDYREDCEEKAGELREIELGRLDTAQAAIWANVIKGDNQSIDRLLRIMQRRAALMGLDAPERVAVALATGLEEADTKQLFEIVIGGGKRVGG